MRTTSQSQSESIDQDAILRWIEALGQAAGSSPGAELLDFDGIGAIDVLLVPLYLAVLGAMRDSANASSSPGVMGRFRQLGYRVKMATRERIAAAKTAQAAPTDYLFWPRDVSHAKFMIPVAQAVGRLGQPWRMVTCQARQFERLRRLVPDPVFARGAWPQVVRKARRDGTNRARQLARLTPWRLDGLLGRADLAVVAQRAVVQFLPLAAEAIANARAALDAFRPKLLVVGNDLTLEGRAASRVAAQRGVPTATFMHGSISGNAMQRLHCVDRMLVYSKSHRQALARQGFADERIVVCGAPYLDQRPRQTGQIHPELQARLGLHSGEPWILVATSGPGHSVSHQHHQTVIDSIVRLSESLPQVPVVVKLHRKDHPSHYQSALRESPCRQARDRARRCPGFSGRHLRMAQWLQRGADRCFDRGDRSHAHGRAGRDDGFLR